jgi:hypothetical protein
MKVWTPVHIEDYKISINLGKGVGEKGEQVSLGIGEYRLFYD